jgi:uncharacterized protein (TIGR02246 family)
MSILSPEDMNTAFAEAYNSGDVERLLALYEPDAVLAPQPGQRAVGHSEIRVALQAFLQLKGTMRSRNVYCIRVDNVAMLQAEWHLSAFAPDGKAIELSSHTAEVLRQQSDGSWLYVIDHAFGNDS